MDQPIQFDQTPMSSEKSFGLVFAGFFALVASVRWYRHGRLEVWLYGAALAFLLVALVMPRVLRPLNTVWFRLGLALNRVTSPVIMGAIFFLAIVPTALLLRLVGKRPMSLSIVGRKSDSYWVACIPVAPDADTMTHQF